MLLIIQRRLSAVIRRWLNTTRYRSRIIAVCFCAVRVLGLDGGEWHAGNGTDAIGYASSADTADDEAVQRSVAQHSLFSSLSLSTNILSIRSVCCCYCLTNEDS